MFPGIDPRQMKMAMKKLGLKQEDIDAEEVIIKCRDKQLRIVNPQVTKIEAGGQETIQITGEITEEPIEKFNEDDIKTVMEQTGCNEEEAKNALEETGDLAEAILKLKNH